jgi:hypothetical protein
MKVARDYIRENSVIQLFADIKDYRGEHSEYIDYQIRLY